MATISTQHIGDHEYAVTVTQGQESNDYRVRVPVQLMDRLGVPQLDEEELVRESFVFLLEREPPSAILKQFGLDVISRYFPEYENEIRGRLAR